MKKKDIFERFTAAAIFFAVLAITATVVAQQARYKMTTDIPSHNGFA